MESDDTMCPLGPFPPADGSRLPARTRLACQVEALDDDGNDLRVTEIDPFTWVAICDTDWLD